MAYASKYYDPVKAHEYYEKHKQLKGQSERKSTAKLSDEAKAIAQQIKETINEKKKEYMDAVNGHLKDKIKAIRERMKGMSKEEKERLKEEISTLKEQYKAVKEQAKAMFEEEYLKELDNLKADPSMLKPKKGKKSSKKKSKKK